ncbi:MAG: galactokinase [Glaciecola sp.]
MRGETTIAELCRRENIIALGKLLFESHYGLQHQYEVSCKELDFLVQLAKQTIMFLEQE